MKKVLVIGDGCKDVFLYGKCEKLCPEAPVPVFKPTKNNFNGGMAVNVYNNLRALDVDCDVITDSGATKTRYVDEASNQMLLRVDENDKLKNVTTSKLSSIQYDKYDAIVISDYNKGFLTEMDIVYIQNNHPLVFMDTKKKIDKWAYGIEFIKINEKEFKENVNTLVQEMPNDIIVTLGKMGAVLFHNDDGIVKETHFPIEDEHPVKDLSGAGDTFLAALVAKFIENNDICEAINYANKCASWVVTQKGVVVVNKNKI